MMMEEMVTEFQILFFSTFNDRIRMMRYSTDEP